MRVEEIMTKNPLTVTMETTVQDVARKMAEKDVGFIPIVDGQGRAVGTVTDRDIAIRVVAKGMDPRSTKLSDFGGNEVASCQPGDDISKARELMQREKIQRVLVCDAQKKPIGVISLQDLTQSGSEREVGATVREVKEEGASVH
jgi:CBS domain-containing protein